MDHTGNRALQIKVVLDFENRSTEKKGVLNELAQKISDAIHVASSIAAEAMLEREAISTTGFGNGLAIPHAKLAALDSPQLFFFRLAIPAEWEAMDDLPVKNIFVILVPETDKDNTHLKILSKLSYHLMDDDYQDQIRETVKASEMKKLIRQMLKD